MTTIIEQPSQPSWWCGWSSSSNTKNKPFFDFELLEIDIVSVTGQKLLTLSYSDQYDELRSFTIEDVQDLILSSSPSAHRDIYFGVERHRDEIEEGEGEQSPNTVMQAKPVVSMEYTRKLLPHCLQLYWRRRSGQLKVLSQYTSVTDKQTKDKQGNIVSDNTIFSQLQAMDAFDYSQCVITPSVPTTSSPSQQLPTTPAKVTITLVVAVTLSIPITITTRDRDSKGHRIFINPYDTVSDLKARLMEQERMASAYNQELYLLNHGIGGEGLGYMSLKSDDDKNNRLHKKLKAALGPEQLHDDFAMLTRDCAVLPEACILLTIRKSDCVLVVVKSKQRLALPMREIQSSQSSSPIIPFRNNNTNTTPPLIRSSSSSARSSQRASRTLSLSLIRPASAQNQPGDSSHTQEIVNTMDTSSSGRALPSARTQSQSHKSSVNPTHVSSSPRSINTTVTGGSRSRSTNTSISSHPSTTVLTLSTTTYLTPSHIKHHLESNGNTNTTSIRDDSESDQLLLVDINRQQDKVLSIKQQISDMIGLPIDKQRLIIPRAMVSLQVNSKRLNDSEYSSLLTQGSEILLDVLQSQSSIPSSIPSSPSLSLPSHGQLQIKIYREKRSVIPPFPTVSFAMTSSPYRNNPLLPPPKPKPTPSQPSSSYSDCLATVYIDVHFITWTIGYLKQQLAKQYSECLPNTSYSQFVIYSGSHSNSHNHSDTTGYSPTSSPNNSPNKDGYKELDDNIRLIQCLPYLLHNNKLISPSVSLSSPFYPLTLSMSMIVLDPMTILMSAKSNTNPIGPNMDHVQQRSSSMESIPAIDMSAIYPTQPSNMDTAIVKQTLSRIVIRLPCCGYDQEILTDVPLALSVSELKQHILLAIFEQDPVIAVPADDTAVKGSITGSPIGSKKAFISPSTPSSVSTSSSGKKGVVNSVNNRNTNKRDKLQLFYEGRVLQDYYALLHYDIRDDSIIIVYFDNPINNIPRYCLTPITKYFTLWIGQNMYDLEDKYLVETIPSITIVLSTMIKEGLSITGFVLRRLPSSRLFCTCRLLCDRCYNGVCSSDSDESKDGVTLTDNGIVNGTINVEVFAGVLTFTPYTALKRGSSYEVIINYTITNNKTNECCEYTKVFLFFTETL